MEIKPHDRNTRRLILYSRPDFPHRLGWILGGLWFQEANDAIVWGLRYLYGSIGLESLYEGERIL